MPMKVTPLSGAGEIHPLPFVGPVDHPMSVRVDVSALTSALVDAYGYLKPGVPLTRAGILPGIAPAFVFGCVIEAVKVATDNGASLATAADIDVAVTTICAVNRAILEDSLGRVLSADEIAAFDRAGSKCVLLY